MSFFVFSLNTMTLAENSRPQQFAGSFLCRQGLWVVAGLVTIGLLILLLVYLNYRKKQVILDTTEELLIAEARYRHLF